MKAIEYSNEHIHVLYRDKEQCFLSRNWSRCTAGLEHELKDFDTVHSAAYHDGDRWVKITQRKLDD